MPFPPRDRMSIPVMVISTVFSLSTDHINDTFSPRVKRKNVGKCNNVFPGLWIVSHCQPLYNNSKTITT